MKRRKLRVAMPRSLVYRALGDLLTEYRLLRQDYEALKIRERERHQELIQCRMRLQRYLNEESIQRPPNHDVPPDALAALAQWEASCFPTIPVTPEEDEAWAAR